VFDFCEVSWSELIQVGQSLIFGGRNVSNGTGAEKRLREVETSDTSAISVHHQALKDLDVCHLLVVKKNRKCWITEGKIWK
jgi:hypothetical protein